MITKAKITDINQILEIVEDAREIIKSQGFKQWTKESNYPNYDVFLNDIKNDSLYIYKDKDIICGMFYLDKYDNIDYHQIDGNWLSNNKYYTIHRLAVRKEYYRLGIGLKLINYAKDIAKSDKVNLRIDTHLKNNIMTNLINKAGFTYCGIIKLAKEKIEPERKAYELILN